MKKFGLFLFLILFMGLLAACMASPPPQAQLNPFFNAAAADTEQEAEEEPDEVQVVMPQGPQVLNLAMPMPITLNPLLNSDQRIARILSLMFEPLVVFDSSMRAVPNPYMVDSIVLSPGGSAITITLAQDIVWQDGLPITSADIAFTINALQSPAAVNSFYHANVANISGHSIIDDRSILLNLHEPQSFIKEMLAFPIVPVSYYADANMLQPASPRNMQPLGNGPFRFVSHVQARGMELAANDLSLRGRPQIDAIHIDILRDYEAEGFAFERGLIDSFVGRQYSWPRFVALGKRRELGRVSNEFDFIGFNFNRAITADVEARRAIAHALDVDLIIGRYYFADDRAIAPIWPQSFLSSGQAGFVHNIGYTMERFEAMGFNLNAMGHRERVLAPALPPMPLEFNIIVNEDSPQRLFIAEVLAIGLREAGALINLEPLSPTAFANRLAAFDYDIFVGSIDLSRSPSLDFLSSENELLNYQSHELDTALNILNYAMHEQARAQAAMALEDYIFENLPIFGIGFNRDMMFLNNRVGGEFHGGGFESVHRWFLTD